MRFFSARIACATRGNACAVATLPRLSSAAGKADVMELSGKKAQTYFLSVPLVVFELNLMRTLLNVSTCKQ